MEGSHYFDKPLIRRIKQQYGYDIRSTGSIYSPPSWGGAVGRVDSGIQ
jgi:hypothetical protein